MENCQAGGRDFPVEPELKRLTPTSSWSDHTAITACSVINIFLSLWCGQASSGGLAGTALGF